MSESRDEIAITPIQWVPGYRIIPSRFPPVGPWDRIAHARDFDALAEIEALTNPRLREELGVLAMIPVNRRIAGPGTTPIMAAFTHLDPNGSRFSNGDYGVLYVARELPTAIRETVHHRERFLKRTKEPPQRLEMRCYMIPIDAPLHDLRDHTAFHHADDYEPSQTIAAQLRAGGSNGVVYRSVRNDAGECVAAFWPDCARPCTQTTHFAYHWDGAGIVDVVELKAVSF